MVHGRSYLVKVICVLNNFNDRDLSLLNSVQHDSYLTTSYKDTLFRTQGSLWQKRACDAPLCFDIVASFKLILCGPVCVDCEYNFALDSKCVDFPPICLDFLC